MIRDHSSVNVGLADESVKAAFRQMMDVLGMSVAVAATGSDQAGAARLTGDSNIVTGADNTKGVVLPVVIISRGGNTRVLNSDATHSLKVYPPLGGQINALGANLPFILGPTQSVNFDRSSLTQWYVGTFTNVTTSNVGTAQTGVTAVEYSGDSQYHKTVLTLATVLPAIAGGAALGVGKKVYVFPAGAIQILSAQINVGITQSEGHINADTPKVGLGSIVAAGVVSVLSGTAAFQDILTGQSAANCTGTATLKTLGPTTPPYIQEAAGSHDVFFNAAATWAASGDAAAILAGTITLNWLYIG